ncbi:MAG TPA: thiamine phosphate synthase [Gaiellaceae bacterium]|nr:thiamine phosphate synthase [Gaiellaceae bacterium]
MRTETAWSSPGPWPADKTLYLVTPVLPELGAFLEAAIRGGVDVVQVRERSLPDGRLLDALAEAREVTARLGVPLGVNDRPDLAVLSGADFVHVGQDDIPVAEARSFGLPVGLSTHAPEEIDAARSDYIAVGPVYATPTKQGRPPVGLELVRYATTNARVPWFAIGGIDASNIDEVVAAGASRVAVVRAIVEADDPEAVARSLRAALPRL